MEPEPFARADDPEQAVSGGSVMTCPNCGARVARDEERCPSCSLPLQVACASCGTESPADEDACPACGAPLSHATEAL